MNNKVLAAKALGFTNSIAKLSNDERQRKPNKSFGDDYNKLLDHIVKIIPEMQEYLPPKSSFYDDGYGTEYCNEPYSEIFTYCEQLYQMLNTIE